MSGSGEGNSLDARNPHLRRVIADAWMGNLGLCKGMRHINLKSSLFSGWSKPTPDELLIIPSWCFVEDPEVQFPPPEDFALDHFILHVSPPVGVYHKGSFRLSVDVRREEDGAMPKVVVYNRLWHPNVDIDGTIAPTVLKRFSDELNEGDAKNVAVLAKRRLLVSVPTTHRHHVIGRWLRSCQTHDFSTGAQKEAAPQS